MAISRGQLGSRGQWILLAGLLAALIAIVAGRWGGDGAGQANGTRVASNTQGRGQPATASRGAPGELDVKLDALQAPRARPGAIERNPFRFEARRTDPVPERAPVRPPPAPAPNPETQVFTPPPPPPIPLKFIGIIESPGVGRVAALTDGRHVFHGRAGDTIEGRYKIVRIGVESIVLEHVEGGSQQTIRLTGQ